MNVYVVIASAIALAACGAVSDDVSADGDDTVENAVTSKDLKTLGVVEGEELALALLAAANKLPEATLVASVSSGGVQLTKTTTKSLLAYRALNPIDTLAELASVPQVGKTSLERLRDYAKAHLAELLGPRLPAVLKGTGDATYAQWTDAWYSSPNACHPSFAQYNDKCDVTVTRLSLQGEPIKLRIESQLQISKGRFQQEATLDANGKWSIQELQSGPKIGYDYAACRFVPGFKSSVTLTGNKLDYAIEDGISGHDSPSDPRERGLHRTCSVSLKF